MATKTKLGGLMSLALKQQSLLTVRTECCSTCVRKSVTQKKISLLILIN